MANDGDLNAIDFAQHIGLEDRVAKISSFDILRNKIYLARKVFLDNFLDPLHAISKFPMPGHDVHAKQFAGIYHVLRIGPQSGSRTLPGIAAIEQQGPRAAGLELFDQGGQVRKPAHLAVRTGGALKINVREGVGLGTAGRYGEHLLQVVSDQVGQIALHGRHAHIHAGLAEMDGH